MKREHKEFNFWQDSGIVHIGHNGDDHEAPVEQRALPLSWRVLGVIHCDQCQDQIRGKIGAACYERLPATYDEPT